MKLKASLDDDNDDDLKVLIGGCDPPHDDNEEKDDARSQSDNGNSDPAQGDSLSNIHEPRIPRGNQSLMAPH